MTIGVLPFISELLHALHFPFNTTTSLSCAVQHQKLVGHVN